MLPKIEKATVFYDTELTGFGLKAFPSGALSWIVEYRPGVGGRGVSKRRMVLGTPKNLTPDEARRRASGILARVRLGEDPAAERSEARSAESVRDLMASFMDDHIRPKRKARTAQLFDGYIKNHVNPALGARKAPALTGMDVERLHKAIGKTNPVTANRVLSLIAAAYSYGQRAKLLSRQGENPASGIERFPEEHRERFLTDGELLRLGTALRQAETLGMPWLTLAGNNIAY